MPRCMGAAVAIKWRGIKLLSDCWCRTTVAPPRGRGVHESHKRSESLNFLHSRVVLDKKCMQQWGGFAAALWESICEHIVDLQEPKRREWLCVRYMTAASLVVHLVGQSVILQAIQIRCKNQQRRQQCADSWGTTVSLENAGASF